ncbi:MAG TPA: glycosyltransferase family 39 protein, partial [Anaerolineae bacterium]|nr:glycosyltransferase family 39 protein [Anaerolineae bacterium]
MSVTYLQSPSSLHRSITPSLILLSSLIFLLAFLPRLGAIDRYVTPDELHWVDRSIRFTDAIAHGHWADTVQSGHPGATTMWLGSIGIAIQHLTNPAIPLPSTSITFDPQNAEAMRALAKFLDAARLPVILVTSFNIALLFLLLSRKIDRRAAFLAAGLIALDPFGVALGSILHVDSLLATFSLVSVAALFIALDHPKPMRWLIVSGVLAGLAALSKSPAIVLGPTTFIVLAVSYWRQQRSIGSFFRSFFIWGICATLVFFALYPAMWVKPIAALGRMAATAEKFGEFAHAVNYFFGSLDRDPGPLFYPVVIAFRSTPILWVGLIAVVPLIFRPRTVGKFVTLSEAQGLALSAEMLRSAQHDKQKNNHEKCLRSIALSLLLFAFLFIGLITLGAKKLDRYVFPALLALDIVGALGLAYAIRWIADRLKDRSRVATSIAIAACFIIASIQFMD